MIQDYSNFIGEGFTVDDDIAAIYVRIFKEGGFNKQPGDDDEQFTDFAMWNSLGKETQNWVLEQSKFTGFLGEGYDSIDILSIAKLDFLLGSVLDCIDNRISFRLCLCSCVFRYRRTDTLEFAENTLYLIKLTCGRQHAVVHC